MVFGSLRNKPAGIMAMVGGLLLALGGWVGMVDTLKIVEHVVVDILGLSDSNILLTFRILIFFAGLGGISIIIGGYLMYKNLPRIGRILVVLGLGVGILGLLINALIAWYNGSLDQFKSYMTHSIEGIGILLSLISTKVAKG